MTQSAAMRINRAALVQRLSRRVGLSRSDASACLETVLALIHRSIAIGDDVKVVGFGRFQLRDRAARQSVHPATGAPLQLEARRVVVFRPSRALKERIDETAPQRADRSSQ